MSYLEETHSIDLLNLPTRARNALARAGITTVEDLAARDDDYLLSRRGFGATSLERVREQLAIWKREHPAPTPPDDGETAPEAQGANEENEARDTSESRRGETLTLHLLPGRRVIHAGWLSGGDSPGRLFLWGEGAAQEPAGQDASPSPHPFQLPPETLRAGLPDLIPEAAQETHAIVRAPAVGDAPQPSPQLIRSVLWDREPDPPDRLGLWAVTGLTLPPLDALAFLNDMPRPEELAPRIALGADLAFWSLAGKFALELLARQQFVPTLHQGRDGAYRALWSPIIDRHEDLRRVEQLAAAMPAVARAISAHSTDGTGSPPAGEERQQEGFAPPSPRALLKDFLQDVSDVVVRTWAPPLLHVVTRRDDPALRTWLKQLFTTGKAPIVDAPPENLKAFQEDLLGWQDRLLTGAEEPFRICFRLEPPESPEQANETGIWTPLPDWTLRFFLQARDDPSLLVPASLVWREQSATLRYLDRRFENPQEKLLTGLGQAARFFPPLSDSLRTTSPEACYLETQQAYLFLREAAPLLEQSGFGVLVPPWWEKRHRQLGVRATISPVETEGQGILNLDALVKFRWQVALGDQAIEPEEFKRLAALKLPLIQVRGEWVELQPEQIEKAIRFWEKRSSEEEATLRRALQVGLSEEGEAGALTIVDVETTGWIRDMMNQLRGGETMKELPPPDGLAGQLRPYQKRGYSWLDYLHRWGLGACLADDMGLGKTIQAISLILHDVEENQIDEPVLVICPTSVVGNWAREIARFAPSLQTVVHHGGDRARGDDFIEQIRQDGPTHVVISTYGLARRDEKTLAQIDWTGVILDEAQNIKNPAAKQTQAIRRLKAGYKVALTGTPVENRLSELWSIMQFLNPGYLGSQKSFRTRFARPIERYQDAQATHRLRKLVQPFVLRRVKTDPSIIQDLPDKLENKVFCTLTPEQATLYQAVVQEALEQVEAAEGMQRRGLVLSMLTRLKQICNHPAHFLGDGSSLSERSGKLARMGEMLEEVLSVDERALIFTQFAAMGTLLQAHLQDLFGGEILFLYGGTPAKQRDRMIARFQEERHGPSIFILSLKAGGLGLNLTRANHVFHFDRWWNPAVENQATDRAFRIGQTRDVWVHKFICAGTLEERIDDMIESKKALAESVIGAGEGWLTELDTNQLRQLVTLSQEAVES